MQKQAIVLVMERCIEEEVEVRNGVLAVLTMAIDQASRRHPAHYCAWDLGRYCEPVNHAGTKGWRLKSCKAFVEVA